jgi:hypothetical protein
MKVRAFNLAIVSSLLLSGCALGPMISAGSTAASAIQAVTAKAGRVEIMGLQGLIIAEEFYQPVNRAALAYLPFADLRQATAIRDGNRLATAALVKGKVATNDVDRAAAAAEIIQGALQMRAATPRSN